MPTDEALLVSIRGRVQGVGFRYLTVRHAEALGLNGWVKNEPDGSVTALVAGPEDAQVDEPVVFDPAPAASFSLVDRHYRHRTGSQ